MNTIKYLKRQLNRLKIDLVTQGTFLAGEVKSIDHDNILKTVSTNYEELEQIFSKRISVSADDVIVDVGCGKGRVFNYLLYKGCNNRMIGYEININVAMKTRERLERFPNVDIRCGNIFNDFPADATIFYLYHPFKEAMMAEFGKQVLRMKHRNPLIIYNNPVYIDALGSQFDTEVFELPVPGYGYNFKFAIAMPKQAKQERSVLQVA